MGWAHGRDKNGRDIGYAVVAKCDEPMCQTIIDRGLAYRCGSIHDEETGCGRFFCQSHLFVCRDEHYANCGECYKARYTEEE